MVKHLTNGKNLDITNVKCMVPIHNVDNGIKITYPFGIKIVIPVDLVGIIK